jgi:hypothetical protein
MQLRVRPDQCFVRWEVVMIFVLHVTRRTRNLSPRARALSDQISSAVDEFRRYYPDTTDSDVESAIIAAGSSYAGGNRRVAMAVAAAAVAVLGVTMAVDGDGLTLHPLIWMGIAAAAAGFIVTATRMARRG